MSRIISAQERSFAIAKPHWDGLRETIGNSLPKAELLRRAVPVLIAVFAALAAIGLVTQTIQARHAALSTAEERLALLADVAMLHLKEQALTPHSDWQGALAASLPKGATMDDRIALLAGADGEIRALAPLVAPKPASLIAILGLQQPLTTFGAEAGVLRITLADGTDAIVTVRDVADTNAQLAFIQPANAALSVWRQEASLEITLLICTGLVLALLGGGLWYLAPPAIRDHDAVSGELTEALSACSVWRWNLARGHVHWSAPMYRLLGKTASEETMAFREIAQALHPDDNLRGEIDRHLRDGKSQFDQSFRLRHADGHFVTMRLRGHITRDNENSGALPDRHCRRRTGHRGIG